jgi:hypothetical protein
MNLPRYSTARPSYDTRAAALRLKLLEASFELGKWSSSSPALMPMSHMVTSGHDP